MNEKNEFRDVNLFKVGQMVDISDIEEMQGSTILRISDSGVAIKCSLRDTTISGRSPARLHIEKKGGVINLSDNQQNSLEKLELTPEMMEIEIKRLEEKLAAIKKPTNFITNVGEETKKAKRGEYTTKMNNIILPAKDKFTIADVAELNNIPNNYANNYIKDNIGKLVIEAGKAEKKEGQRGKSASLFSLKV